jgi:hypothetical protein
LQAPQRNPPGFRRCAAHVDLSGVPRRPSRRSDRAPARVTGSREKGPQMAACAPLARQVAGQYASCGRSRRMRRRGKSKEARRRTYGTVRVVVDSGRLTGAFHPLERGCRRL